MLLVVITMLRVRSGLGLGLLVNMLVNMLLNLLVNMLLVVSSVR